MPTTTSPFELTREQSEFFFREGYLVVNDLIDHAAIDAVIEEIKEEVDDRARELHAQGKLSQLYDQLDFEHRLTMISRETDAVATAIWNGILHGPAIFNLISHPRLLDMVQGVVGPEIIASSVYRLRPKIPGHIKSAVPWHQDSGYFEPYCDKALVMTFWIPLVDATQENGCLWVVPRSHTADALLPHHQNTKHGYLEIDEKDLPKTKAVCCPVRKGGTLLLHNRVAHASFDNKTQGVRWSMDLRYQAAALPTNARVTRLPGEIGAPDFLDPAAPIACYPPEADFLIRSKKRPEQVIAKHADFAKIREQHIYAPVTKRWEDR